MNTNQKNNGVSVVIPCHNESDSIGAVVRGCIETLAERDVDIVVVDDGSGDDTKSAAESAGARVIRTASNQGKGNALRIGAGAARCETLIFMDGDGQDDPGDLPAMLDALTNDVDMVVGSRFLGTLHPGSINPINRMANQAFSLMISMLFKTRITDSQAGFRCMRTKDFASLATGAEEYDIETDMLVRAIKAGWLIREIPVSRFPRTGSFTDFSRIRHGTKILMTIVLARVHK